MEDDEIKVVFFDIGGVMFDGFARPALHAISLKYDKPYVQLQKTEIEAWRAFKIGDCTEEEYFSKIYSDNGIVNGDIEFAKEHVQIIPIKENWGLVPRLKQNGYTVGIISNHAKPWVDRLMAMEDFGKNFNYDVFSCDDDVKSGKPFPKIYTKAMAEITPQVVPWECIFIDDQTKNITAARNLGMHAIQYNHGKDNLEELLRLSGIKI